MTLLLVHARARVFISVLALSSLSLHAQSPTVDPQLLVKDAVFNELRAAKEDNSHWMYLSREEDADGRQTREVVETREGVIYRVIAKQGQPLTSDQQQKEDRRIQRLLQNPDEQRKQQLARDQDAKKASDMLNMLPDAFIYSVAKLEGDDILLNFKPNPEFDPPTREAKVFHSMEGTMLIDEKQKRLKKLSGHLASDVEFGGGFLGRLKQGGTFTFEQTDVGEGHFEPILMEVHITGRALLFKSIKEQQYEVCTNYRRVPNTLSLTQAAELLTKNSPTDTLSSALKSAQ